MDKKVNPEPRAVFVRGQELFLRANARSLRGRIHVTNPGNKRLEPSEATAYLEGVAIPARVRGIVPAGSAGTLRVAAPLDSPLPPGRYKVEIELGDARQETEILVSKEDLATCGSFELKDTLCRG